MPSLEVSSGRRVQVVPSQVAAGHAAENESRIVDVMRGAWREEDLQGCVWHVRD
jgi:hypothetical protein